MASENLSLLSCLCLACAAGQKPWPMELSCQTVHPAQQIQAPCSDSGGPHSYSALSYVWEADRERSLECSESIPEFGGFQQHDSQQSPSESVFNADIAMADVIALWSLAHQSNQTCRKLCATLPTTPPEIQQIDAEMQQLTRSMPLLKHTNCSSTFGKTFEAGAPRTSLSRLASEFVKIPLSSYKACEDFISKNPELLEQDPNGLRKEAGAGFEAQGLGHFTHDVHPTQDLRPVVSLAPTVCTDMQGWVNDLLDKQKQLSMLIWDSTQNPADANISSENTPYTQPWEYNDMQKDLCDRLAYTLHRISQIHKNRNSNNFDVYRFKCPGPARINRARENDFKRQVLQTHSSQVPTMQSFRSRLTLAKDTLDSFARRALVCSALAKRSLSPNELFEAAANVRCGAVSCHMHNSQFSLSQLLTTCSPFLRLLPDGTLTIKDHEVREAILATDWPEARCGRETMAFICLQSLKRMGCALMVRPSVNFVARHRHRSENAFDDYAELYWQEHFRLAESEDQHLRAEFCSMIAQACLETSELESSTDLRWRTINVAFQLCVVYGFPVVGELYLEMGASLAYNYHIFDQQILEYAAKHNASSASLLQRSGFHFDEVPEHETVDLDQLVCSLHSLSMSPFCDVVEDDSDANEVRMEFTEGDSWVVVPREVD